VKNEPKHPDDPLGPGPANGGEPGPHHKAGAKAHRKNWTYIDAAILEL
jgi:hypothetical protein